MGGRSRGGGTVVGGVGVGVGRGMSDFFGGDVDFGFFCGGYRGKFLR